MNTHGNIAFEMNTYTDLQWSGIDHRDAPKYTDAYVSAGKVNGRHMTEDECNALTEDMVNKMRELYAASLSKQK